MTMTRTSLSIRFVLILATVIGIRGEDTPREATLTLLSNFEDGLSDRELRVDYVGFSGSEHPVIKIFREGDTTPKVAYTIEKDAEIAKVFYFQLNEKEATEGSYYVKVCAAENCSEKRHAFGKILKEDEKPTLSCVKGKGQEENVFHTFLNDEGKEDFKIKIKGGESFLTQPELAKSLGESSAYAKYKFKSNPTYLTVDTKKIFYAAVYYNGTHLKDLLDTAVEEAEQKRLEEKYKIKRKLASEVHSHGYCSRKYIFWASAHVMSQGKKVVLRRYRGTIVPNELIVNHFILNPAAPFIPVEFTRYDEESKELPAGDYDVSISFCATDKDAINSSVCSEAIFSTFTVE